MDGETGVVQHVDSSQLLNFNLLSTIFYQALARLQDENEKKNEKTGKIVRVISFKSEKSGIPQGF
jgi:hypothetical protein